MERDVSLHSQLFKNVKKYSKKRAFFVTVSQANKPLMNHVESRALVIDPISN